MSAWASALLALALAGVTADRATAANSPSDPAGVDWMVITPPAGSAMPPFRIARTETTIGQFRRFVTATGLRTEAEKRGGGEVYETGWVRKPGWVWSSPFGRAPGADAEPVAHVTWHEAQAFCRWAGGALPTDAQWGLAAYTETRERPLPPFERGRTYPYPTGAKPTGAQCLDDCGAESSGRTVRHGATLMRGEGPALAGATPAGVNGLHEMGANLWEWVDAPPGAPARTRGGSWWYGAGPMRDDHRQSKPTDTAVVYIGFRCARPA
jgi:formylglycine-generating enzyme required for sulfatase activity